MVISIITVVFNGESTIKDTIESVLGQDYPNIEYIIVDGQSTDRTIEIVQSYGIRISRFMSEPDAGLYDAMNKGIELASGDVIGMLNADDVYASPTVISEVARMFVNPNTDAVYGDLLYVDHRDTSLVRRNWKAGLYKPGGFYHGWMPPHPTFFIRREWYSKYGGYRLDLRSAADYELMLRMIHKFHAKPAYLQKVMVRMRVGGISNVSFFNRVMANTMDRKAWRVNQLTPYPHTLLVKPLRKIFQFFP